MVRSGSILSIAAGLCLLLFGSVEPAIPDDRDLLRFETANPYLFILLDTSTSMTLKMGAGNVPTEGYGDDPSSRLYGAKAALFDVFNSVNDVNFGFATFNQDELRVQSKHHLLYADFASLQTSNWPLDWPMLDPDGLTNDANGDGIVDNDIEGDTFAFGKWIDPAGVGVAGSCTRPLDLHDVDDRRRANAFPKFNFQGSGPEDTVSLGEERADWAHLPRDGPAVCRHLSVDRPLPGPSSRLRGRHVR